MIWIARIYLAIMLALMGAIGVLAIVAPDKLIANFDLLPKSPKGLAEMRGLYGGAFVSWTLAGLAAWRWKNYRPGLLAGIALSMGAIALVRLVSLAIEHEPGFNVPALVGEGLIALACWALIRHEKSTA
jgi:hypothetical protein